MAIVAVDASVNRDEKDFETPSDTSAAGDDKSESIDQGTKVESDAVSDDDNNNSDVKETETKDETTIAVTDLNVSDESKYQGHFQTFCYIVTS